MTAMPAIAVIAGGLATRLGDLTKAVPKSMIPVAGEPFVAHQLRLFRREGIRRVVLCVGHLSESLTQFVGDGTRFGLEVLYSKDGETLVGTGGAVSAGSKRTPRSRGDGGRTGSVIALSPLATDSVDSFGCGHRIGQCWLASASRMRWPFGTVRAKSLSFSRTRNGVPTGQGVGCSWLSRWLRLSTP